MTAGTKSIFFRDEALRSYTCFNKYLDTPVLLAVPSRFQRFKATKRRRRDHMELGEKVVVNYGRS